MESIKQEQLELMIAQLARQFKGLELYIEQSFRENTDFRLLCEDYAVCALALENWKSIEGSKNRERCEEYEQMLAELKKEIQNWLDERYLTEHVNQANAGLAE